MPRRHPPRDWSGPASSGIGPGGRPTDRVRTLEHRPPGETEYIHDGPCPVRLQPESRAFPVRPHHGDLRHRDAPLDERPEQFDIEREPVDAQVARDHTSQVTGKELEAALG